MDSQVEGDHNPRNGSGTEELSVAEECRGTMVVAVKEGCRTVRSPLQSLRVLSRFALTQWLLLQEQEHGI